MLKISQSQSCCEKSLFCFLPPRAGARGRGEEGEENLASCHFQSTVGAFAVETETWPLKTQS